LLDFFGHSVNCTKGIDASPHTNYLQIFKEHPGPQGSGNLRVTAHLHLKVVRYRTTLAAHFCVPSEGGRIIAMSYDPSTFIFPLLTGLFRAAAQAARGAQYSPDSTLVNAL